MDSTLRRSAIRDILDPNQVRIHKFTARAYTLHTIRDLLCQRAMYILSYIAAFVAPAAVIIPIKAVFGMEKSKI